MEREHFALETKAFGMARSGAGIPQSSRGSSYLDDLVERDTFREDNTPGFCQLGDGGVEESNSNLPQDSVDPPNLGEASASVSRMPLCPRCGSRMILKPNSKHPTIICPNQNCAPTSKKAS